MNNEQKKMLVKNGVLLGISMFINKLIINWVDKKEKPGMFVRTMRKASKQQMVLDPIVMIGLSAMEYNLLEPIKLGPGISLVAGVNESFEEFIKSANEIAHDHDQTVAEQEEAEAHYTGLAKEEFFVEEDADTAAVMGTHVLAPEYQQLFDKWYYQAAQSNDPKTNIQVAWEAGFGAARLNSIKG
jgi:hypothetical protein